MGVQAALLKPVVIPQKIESILPNGAPSISGIMSKIAGKVPNLGGTASISGLRLPRVAPIVSKVEENIPGVPKVSSLLAKGESTANLKLNQLTGQKAKAIGDGLKVKESPAELIAAAPEGLRTAVPGLSAFTQAHLTQSVAMQGARGSL
jgi:hypothetical protein